MLPTMEIVLPLGAASAGTSNVPAFLAKLWKMVDDPGTNHLISWSDEGTSFQIHNQAEFAQSLLPYYYKHSNMASFVRQLNMYGFHKVVGIESGGLKSEKQEEMEFAHSYFIRGMEILLDKIKRKVSANKTANYVPAMKTERVNEVLNEVSIIRDRQEDLDSKLDTMKKENEALWREVVNLRQKHQAQQKIVNKLIHFLVSMVQPRMGQAVKRRYPNQLAIEDAYEAGGKDLKLDLGDAESGGNTESAAAAAGFDLGPIISEVTSTAQEGASGGQFVLGGLDFLPNEMVNIEMPDTPEPVVTAASSNQQDRPTTPFTAAMRAVDPSLVNPSIHATVRQQPVKQQQQNVRKTMPAATTAAATITTGATPAKKPSVITVMTPKRPVYKREISKEDFDLETNIMQKDLDNLKDILSGQITFDSSFLTSLFNPEEPMPNLVFPAGSQASSNVGGMVSPGAATQLQLELDNNGISFELGDMDEGNSTGQQNSRDDSSFSVSSLNTPLVFADQTDPMVAHMRNSGKMN